MRGSEPETNHEGLNHHGVRETKRFGLDVALDLNAEKAVKLAITPYFESLLAVGIEICVQTL